MSNNYSANYSDGNYPIIIEPSNPPVPTAPAGMPQYPMNVNSLGVITGQQVAMDQLTVNNRNLTNACDQLAYENSLNRSEITSLERQNEALRRSRRKKVSSVSIWNDKEDSVIYLCSHYDNGEITREQLITNCNGPMLLYTVKGLDLNLPKEYVNIVVGEQKQIILESKKLYNGKYLYNTFLAAGIHFNDKVKDSHIQKALSKYFVSLLENQYERKFKVCSGWNNFDFRVKECRSSLAFGEGSEADFPFLKKSMEYVPLTIDRVSNYFSELRQFTSWRDRIIMLLYPFLGLLFTLLQKHYKYQDFYLNLILEDDTPSDMVASWFQIYNRDSLSVIEPPQTKKRFNEFLLTICDDVLLLDVRSYNGDDQYSKNKNEAFANNVAQIVNNHGAFGDGKKLRAAVVLLSNKYRSGNVINLKLPSAVEGIARDKHEQYLNLQCFESILCGLIVYIQNHSEVMPLLLEKKHSKDCRAELLQTAMDILEVFFRDIGYSLNDKLDFPENIDFTAFFADEEDDNSTATANFVEHLRGQMGNYIAYPKQPNAVFDVNSLYYDDEWVYFPCQMLRAMFQDLHRDQFLPQALLALREAGDLWTDAANLTVKKVQLSGVRTNFYVVRRKALNPIGYTDIIALTKEDEEVC